MEGFKLLALAENFAGHAERAIEAAEKAMLVDPYYPDVVLQFLGQACFMAGDLRRAAEILRQRVRRNPNTDTAHVYLAAIHGHWGETGKARAEWAEVLRFNPGYSLAERIKVWPYADPAAPLAIVEGLNKAGIETDFRQARP